MIPLRTMHGGFGKVSLTTRVQQRVRQLRAARGLTQEMLCQAAGISLDAVSRIENGTRAPSLETVEKLARGLGVSVTHLLGIAGDEAALVFPPRVMRLAYTLAGSDEHVQRAAEGLVKVLLRMAARRRKQR